MTARRLAPLCALLLAGCPQTIEGLDSGHDGGAAEADAGLPPPKTCTRTGPGLSCTVSPASKLAALGSIYTVTCNVQSSGRAVTFSRVLRPAIANVTDTLQQDGKLLVQLPASKVDKGFPDTEIAADVTVAWADDAEACTTQRATMGYAGNLWVADPSRAAVVAIASDETVLGEAIGGFAQPTLVANVKEGVLVGGAPTSGGPVELHVYGRDGKHVRGPFERKIGIDDQLASRALHSAVQLDDGRIFVSLGTGDQPGKLLVYDATGTTLQESPMPQTVTPRGLATTGAGVLVAGVLKDGSVARGAPGGLSLTLPAYKDAVNAPCDVDAVFGVTSLSTGGLALAVRHRTTSTPLGMLVQTDAALVVQSLTAHTHPNGGSMVPEVFDWLAEPRAGVLVGTRNGGTSIDQVDATTHGEPRRAWAGFAGTPRAMVRLR